MNVGSVILCGGRSTRMGVPKATLPFGDELMLQRVVRLLSEVTQPLIVVASPRQQMPELPERAIVARDEREGLGPLEGLRAGMAAIGERADAVYATGCDVPLLVPGFVRRMIELLEDYDITVPVDGEHHHPLAAVYRTGVLPQIEALLADSRLRTGLLFGRCRTREVPLAALRAVDADLLTLMNCNTPADYLQALSRAGLSPPPSVLQRFRAHDREP